MLPLCRTPCSSPLLLLRAVDDATWPARKSELQRPYVRCKFCFSPGGASNTTCATFEHMGCSTCSNYLSNFSLHHRLYRGLWLNACCLRASNLNVEFLRKDELARNSSHSVLCHTLIDRSNSVAGNLACGWLARKSLNSGWRPGPMLCTSFSRAGSQDTTKCRFFRSSQSPEHSNRSTPAATCGATFETQRSITAESLVTKQLLAGHLVRSAHSKYAQECLAELPQQPTCCSTALQQLQSNFSLSLAHSHLV